MFNPFKKSQPPEVPIAIRDTLFGDQPLEQWPPGNRSSDAFPWSAFVAARNHLAAGKVSEAIACWREVTVAPGLESRHYAQAWHFLRQQGQTAPPEVAKTLLGVVIEVGMPKGLDLLAAYPERTARYYNFSGAGVVWEHPDDSLDPFIDALLQSAAGVVAQIGPWDKARPAPPLADHCRLSFLTPSGLHFGQGGLNVLSADPLGGRVLQTGAALMNALITKTQKPKG